VVGPPPSSVEVATHDALDRNHLGPLDHHGAACQLFEVLSGEPVDSREVGGEQVMRNVEQVEPVE
jgi:hypothetical protein